MSVQSPAPRVLPERTIVGPVIGHGRRSLVFAGEWEGTPVVLKCYSKDAIEKYRRRYRVSIAQFEHDRNAEFWAVEELRPFVAKPIRAITADEGHLEVFVQQRVQGRALREFLGADNRLSASILNAIDQVVEIAERHGLHDIDMSPSNFLMQPDGDGWRPVLFDFNLMPQYRHAPNPVVGLLYRFGLRHPAHRDRWMLRRLRTWPD